MVTVNEKALIESKMPDPVDQARMLRCLISNLKQMTTNENAYNDNPSSQTETASFDECSKWLGHIEALVTVSAADLLDNYADDIAGIFDGAGLDGLTDATYGTPQFYEDGDVYRYINRIKLAAESLKAGVWEQ